MARFEPSRWAEALVESSGEKAVEAVDSLEAIAGIISSSSILSRPLSGPMMAHRFKTATERALGESIEKDSPSGAEYARRITILLAKRGRLGGIAEVVSAARAILERNAGILRVRSESALPLDDDIREALRASMARRTGAAEILLEERVDPSLLGGLRIELDGERIDGTLRRRLEALASAMGASKRGGGIW